MRAVSLRLTIAVVVLLALGAALSIPGGIQASRLVAAEDDPARLADVQLEGHFDEAVAAREIEAALTASDPELASSFLELARERGVVVAPALSRRVEAAVEEANSATATAGRFASGLVYGEGDDLAGLAGTITGDLLVIGDVRDLLRETGKLLHGERADELILGLSCVGLAVTAGAYATLGLAAPARAGVSVAKVAAKTGRLGARLAETLVRPLRTAVDTPALKAAVAAGATEPAAMMRGLRQAVRLERAGGVVDALGDLGRVQAKAGTRAALEGVRLAETPKDMTRLARLAAAKGGKTRAVLKVLGRGAIALTVGLLELAAWLFWAVLNLLGLLLATKRLVERTTLAAIRRRKGRRAERAHAGAAALTVPQFEPAHAVLSLR